jgi:hypothetical protein
MAGSLCQSVAGKAEKVAAVVHELMHIRPTNEGSGTLLRAHKIDRQQKNKPRENRPWEPLTQRYCGGRASWCVCGVRHAILLGLRVPLEFHIDHEEGLALDPTGSNTVARPRRTHTGFLTSRNHPKNRERNPNLQTRTRDYYAQCQLVARSVGSAEQQDVRNRHKAHVPGGLSTSLMSKRGDHEFMRSDSKGLRRL